MSPAIETRPAAPKVLDLAPYRLPTQVIPSRVHAAAARGVRRDGAGLALDQAFRLLAPGYLELEDGVARNADGTLYVCVRTEMPRVETKMIDWWFGWHMPSSERYQIWHPVDHVKSFAKHDRTLYAGERSAYVGNVSYVDEYIGRRLMRLSIRFAEPEVYRLDSTRFSSAGVGTAVCAQVALRGRGVSVGHLIHLVRETPDGVEMRSRFWLGHITVRGGKLGHMASSIANRAGARKLLVPDALGIDLMWHCAQEMGRLARLLPALYADVHGLRSGDEVLPFTSRAS